LGVGAGVIQTYLFLFLSELKGTTTLMGLSLSITCASEIPIFFFSGAIMNKIGAQGMIYLAMISYVIRLTYYSFLKQPWYVLPAEALHGLTFAASWSACVKVANDISPIGLGATTQGLLTGIYSGLGSGTGALVGGIVYHKFGAVILFRASAIAVGIGFIIYFISNQIKRLATTSAKLVPENSHVDLDASLIQNYDEKEIVLSEEFNKEME